MTSVQGVLGIVRAVRPQYRNGEDRLAFFVHAFMLAEGYKLVAVGQAAEDLEKIDSESREVGLEGWTALAGSYAFAYTDAAGERSPVLIKALPVSEKLLVHVLRQATKTPPETFELDVAKYTASAADPADGYKNLDEVLALLDKAVKPKSNPVDGQQTSAKQLSASASGRGQAFLSPSGEDASAVSRLRDMPTSGSEDIVPPGIPHDITGIPGISSGPVLPGGRDIPGGAFPSGMHVGPNDPMFSGRRPQQPGFGLPEGPFPGVRYDPVNPQGLEGFNAGDFQRERHFHPDLMPPGRGSGPDFDRMCG